MTNNMPERIQVSESLGGQLCVFEYIKGTEYTRTDLCVPQDVLRQVAEALGLLRSAARDNEAPTGSFDQAEKAIAALQPYLKEKP